MFNLSIVLEENARRRGDSAAVQFDQGTLTFAQLNSAADNIAAGLRDLGIEPGERVALSCPNLPWFAMVYFGILKAGCAVVPLNILLTSREVAYHLRDSLASAYFCFEGTEDLPVGTHGVEAFADTPSCRHLIALPASSGASHMDGAIEIGDWLATDAPRDELTVPNTEPQDTAVILYTSGTTGQPKGAELSHFNLFMNARVVAEMIQLTPEDRQLIVLPLFHSFGQVVQLVTGALVGACSVLLPRFEPTAALRLLHDEKISVFAGVPTMYWALLQADATEEELLQIGNTLRVSMSGGASLPVQVLKDFEAKFKVPILEGYGLSETSPVACFNHLDRVRKPGSIGQPIWGVEMRLVDQDGQELGEDQPGEILIKGHNVMKGYFSRAAATAESIIDGWFHTGDVAKRDGDGDYFIVDRTKDMIIRGGFNVYPREVEEVLMEHPKISLVSVIGVPHDEYGEEIKAFVVLKDSQELSTEELVSWSRDRLAAYKYPRQVEFRDALPMNATGKVLKRELRENSDASS